MFDENKKINNSYTVKHLPKNIINGETYSIEQQKPNSYTHGFFKYPCKFIPEIPRWAIKKYADKKSLIFDPFAGSGTTLLEAKILGHDAYGTEIDPVAKKIIKAKTQNYSVQDLKDIDTDFNYLLQIFSDKPEQLEIFVPAIKNLKHWFNDHNAKILGQIKTFIDNIENQNSKTFFEIVMLSIVKPVSNADDASPKPYVSSKVIKTPPDALERFKQTFIRYKKMLHEYAELNTRSEVKIVKGDALHTEESFTADLAITSPPYINAFDYPRTLRLENLWVETHTEESILKSKEDYVGTERFNLVDERKKSFEILNLSKSLSEKFELIKLVDEKRAYVVKKFFEDMKQNMMNVNKHLVKNGHYVIVIGNSTIRKQLIESWRILIDLAPSANFELVEHFSYNIKNPYIRIPRKGRGGRIKKDYVIVLKKI